MGNGIPCQPPLVVPQPNRQRAKVAKGKPTGDRWQTFNRIIDDILAPLTNAEARALMILFRDARADIARTAQSDIARRAGVSRRAIVDALQSLKQRGLIEIIRRGNLRNGVSEYRILPQKTSNQGASI